MGKRRKRRIATDTLVMIVILVFVGGFVLLNLASCHHARRMMRFSEKGDRTMPSDELSGWDKTRVLFTGVNVPRPSNKVSPADIGLEFSTHTIAVSSNINLEAWYMEQPASKGAVLMFHGYAEAKGALLDEAIAFHDMGYSTFLVDFRGSGGSDGNDTTLGFVEANDVSAAASYFGENISADVPLVLYGQSMGGAAILRALSAEGAEPVAVVVESVFDTMLSTVANRFQVMGLPSFPCANMMVYWGARQRGFSGSSHNPVEYAGDVITPVLVLHGAEDDRAKPDQAKAVYRALDGPKRFKLLDGVKHGSCFAAAPEEWKAEVSAFLADPAGASDLE